MKKFVLTLIALVVSATAHADLKSTFKKLDTKRKGPFAQNMLQGSRGRAVATFGNPSGTFQFQAAFRNEIGQELAIKHDFYTANLFTTNYYELMGEYVYGNIYGSHELDHQGLLKVVNRAMPKANSMVRHWVLERAYMHQFPNSVIARAFKLRGISGAEFEQAYAYHFFNMYLTGATEDQQYLPAFLLMKGSAISQSGGSSLERARNVIAQAYDHIVANFGNQDAGVKRLYQLRNAVHNQLSQAIIKQIDSYIREFPGYAQYIRPSLNEVRSILVSYYSVSTKRVIEQAKKAGATEVQTQAEAIAKSGVTVERLLALSKSIADLRGQILDVNAIPTAKKTDTLLLIYETSLFLNKEVNSMTSVASKDVIKIILNLIFIEGFLIQDNWQYFLSEVDAAANVKAAADLLPDVIGIANDTLMMAFSPSYEQWVSIEPKMNYFVDNTIKSSALNTASLVAGKIKK